MASLMGGEPEVIGLDVRREHAEHGAAATRTARIAGAVAAHEHEPAVDDLAVAPRIQAGQRLPYLELDPANAHVALRGSNREHEPTPAGAARATDEEQAG